MKINFNLLIKFILSKFLKKNYNLSCKTQKAEGMFINKTVPTIIYINCTKIKIQLSIFYKREEFYWIGEDEKKIGGPILFGDTPRAFKP